MPIWTLVAYVGALYRWAPKRAFRMTGLALLAATISLIGG